MKFSPPSATNIALSGLAVAIVALALQIYAMQPSASYHVQFIDKNNLVLPIGTQVTNTSGLTLGVVRDGMVKNTPWEPGTKLKISLNGTAYWADVDEHGIARFSDLDLKTVFP